MSLIPTEERNERKLAGEDQVAPSFTRIRHFFGARAPRARAIGPTRANVDVAFVRSGEKRAVVAATWTRLCSEAEGFARLVPALETFLGPSLPPLSSSSSSSSPPPPPPSSLLQCRCDIGLRKVQGAATQREVAFLHDPSAEIKIPWLEKKKVLTRCRTRVCVRSRVHAPHARASRRECVPVAAASQSRNKIKDNDVVNFFATTCRTRKTGRLHLNNLFFQIQFQIQPASCKMVSFVANFRATSSIYHLCACTTRTLTTSAMPSPKDEAKEVIVSYLDGKDNGIAVLGLNRPAARNSLGKVLISQLNEALASIRQNNKLRVLIVRSLIPKIFCAGADLRERVVMDNTEVLRFVSSLRDLMSNVETLPTPVISAIDGAAIGGGLELALASDIRVASSEAKMGLVETKLAIIPGAGGTQRLPRIIGVAKAKELIYTARILDGEQAMRLGLVNEVVPQNKIGDAAYQMALSIAREILPNGPIGVRLAKVAISKGTEVSLEDGMEIEQQCYTKLADTKDRIEGLAAFAAKRVPVYQGA